MNDSRALYGGHDIWSYGVEETGRRSRHLLGIATSRGWQIGMSPEDLFLRIRLSLLRSDR